MCLFFESIKIIHGEAVNLWLHEERINRTRLEYLGLPGRISLKSLIRVDSASVYKCRIIYSDKIEAVETVPYTPRKIEYLKVADVDEIDYRYKFLDRRCFNDLTRTCDINTDVLIVRNNLITDTSFANIIFWDGRFWNTPATPLLQGTKREFLLRKGITRKQDIRIEDLPSFRFAKLINAMLDIEDSPAIEIGNIRK